MYICVFVDGYTYHLNEKKSSVLAVNLPYINFKKETAFYKINHKFIANKLEIYHIRKKKMFGFVFFLT